MNALSLASPEQATETNYPTVAPSVAPGQGQGLSDKHHLSQRYLTDGEREIRIGQHGSLMLHFMAEWDAHGNFDDRGHAERHLMLMSDLIRGRSPEQVARMERERGIA